MKTQKIGPFLIAISIIFTIALLYYPSVLQSFNNFSLQSSSKCTKNSDSTLPETPEKAVEDSEMECDLFAGEWVPNLSAPYYTNETCGFIQQHQNCMKYGRPDTWFMKWKWKPYGCELPIFDPVQFLEIVKGKSLAFVGDSVARNHMQSLICLLSRVEIPHDISNTTDENFKRWKYETYNFTISIFWSPYLVRAQRTDPNDISQPFNLYLDEFDESWTNQVEPFDYVIISAGHWFTRPTTFYIKRRVVGCLYCPEANITHMTSYFSYQRAFRTAFKAINRLKNYKGLTLLRTFVPSHFENGLWNETGDCVRTWPFRREEVLWEDLVVEMYKAQVKELGVAEQIGRKRGLKFRIMDLTKVMLLRPDGHPGKYGRWPNENVTTNDCVHWCLPGPIDTWNDFLLEIMKWEEALLISSTIVGGEEVRSLLPPCDLLSIYNFSDSNSDTDGISAVFVPISSPYTRTVRIFSESSPEGTVMVVVSLISLV
ncbi:hypothetical protein LguiB_019544 [Lonicera macranthoides]